MTNHQSSQNPDFSNSVVVTFINRFSYMLITSILTLIIVFIGNLLSNGWIIRILGGVAFKDIYIIQDIKEFAADDIQRDVQWEAIKQASDEVNRKYVCYFTRVSTISGGICALKQEGDKWFFGFAKNSPATQRCNVSCLVVERKTF